MAYKVVTKQLTSCFGFVHQMGVEYIPNRWKKAKTPMFVFKLLKDAVHFKVSSSVPSSCQIWRCRTKGMAPIAAFLSFTSLATPHRKKFWETILRGDNPWSKPGFSVCTAFKGSYRADEVMITKKVR